MSEFEILENNSLNYINNGMYMVALAILIFIALRQRELQMSLEEI